MLTFRFWRHWTNSLQKTEPVSQITSPMSSSRTEILVTKSFSPKHSATATDILCHIQKVAWTFSSRNWAWNQCWKLLNSDEVWTLHRKASITRNILLETHLYPSAGVLATLQRALLMVLWGGSTGADSPFPHKLSSSWATTACRPRELWIVPVPGHQPHGHTGCLSSMVSALPHLCGDCGQYLTLGAWPDLPCPAQPTVPRHHSSLAIQALPSAGPCSPPYAYTHQPGCSHLRNTSTLSHGAGGEPQQ